MLYPAVARSWDGVEIQGQQVRVLITPSLDGKLGVSVIAEASLTGFDRACRITSSEDTPYFTPHEVVVEDTRLVCLAADRNVPFFRSGFIMDIEPGMARELRTWLPKLATVTELSDRIARLFARQLDQHVYHQHSEISAVVARVKLDGLPADEAVTWAKENSASKNDKEFMAQFDSEAVRDILK